MKRFQLIAILIASQLFTSCEKLDMDTCKDSPQKKRETYRAQNFVSHTNVMLYGSPIQSFTDIVLHMDAHSSNKFWMEVGDPQKSSKQAGVYSKSNMDLSLQHIDPNWPDIEGYFTSADSLYLKISGSMDSGYILFVSQ